MRNGLFMAATAVLLATPVVGPAADPPIVFQTQPVGKLLDDARAVATLIAGEKAVKEFNDSIKRTFGEKGLDGLDLNRPVVGYFLVPANPEQTTVVVALPVSGEKEFLDLCERANKQKPKPLGDGLFELPPPNVGDPAVKAVMRFADGYAYLGAGKDPTPALDAKALVPMPKLFDPTERAQLAGKVYFDRLPKELRAKIAQGIDEAKKQVAQFPLLLGPGVNEVFKEMGEEMSKLGTRYLDLAKDADTLTGRVNVEPGNAEAVIELALNGKPGTTLAKDIAARKPTTNQFAGLVTKDAVAGFRAQLPLFAPEVRKAAVIGLRGLEKLTKSEAPPPFQKSLDELFKGLTRTVESGEFDLAGAMRGPDKDGTFTIVGAVAFDDPRALEKELKELVNGIPEVKGLVTFDVAKVGNVSIHQAKVGDQLPPEPRKMFGGNASIAVAFAPKGIYVAFGADAVGAVKEALAAKGGPAPALEVVLNPSRMAKVAVAGGGKASDITDLFGPTDAPFTAGSLTIEGGKELRLRMTLSLRLFTALFTTRGRASDEPPPPPPIKK
jgi:hypothetical protein